jgi:hypothetical protein
MNSLRSLASILAITLGLFGCASVSSDSAMPRRDEHRSAAVQRELAKAEAELQILQASSAPDCPHVCRLVANICDLAQRICAMADEEGSEELRSRCRDGTLRCQRARAATAAGCGCGAKPQQPMQTPGGGTG